MKKLAFFVLALASLYSSTAQAIQPLQRDLLWQKSKHQRTAGWLLLGGGTTLVIIGGVIYTKSTGKQLVDAFGNLVNPTMPTKTNEVNGGGIVAAGLVCMAGRIPFFMLSGKNRRLAIGATSFQLPIGGASRWTVRRMSGIKLKFTRTIF